MTINYTTNLSLAEPVTGSESGTWGDDVNKGLTDYLDISIAGTLALTSASFTANALTLANTTGSSSSNGIVATTAQYYILKLSSLAAAVTITAPSSSKTYLVYNSDSTYSATIKASGQSGVSVVAGERALVFFNGTDYVKASSTVLTNFTGVLTGTYGGTGVNNGSNTITIAGNLTHAGAFTQSFTASANTAVTLPAGATASTNNLLSSATAVAIVTGTPSSTTYLRGDGTWATIAAGVSLSAANTWTATQTFNGSSSTFAEVLLNAAETTTVSATAATGTINFYINSQSVLYYTSNASANWTLNVAFSSGTSLNTAMSTGQTVTLAFLNTNGSTAYYASAFTIDGTSVTPKWQGGTAPTAGNASGIDVYTYSITKTASATYTVLASQTQFK